MSNEKNGLFLIEETISPLKERRGGAANLILTALLVESTRMIDDGFDVVPVEEAAKKTFGIQKGFLSRIDDLGIPKVVAFMEHLSDTSDPEDSLTRVYNNFFIPAKSATEILEVYRKAEEEDRSAVVLASEADAKKIVYDFMLVETLGQKFKAVTFMVATELVESGIAELAVLEKLCTSDLLWKEGPFSMMNSMGIDEALKIVTERMFLSHRKEINFPVPRLLITQAQKNTPWLIYPKN
jgi:3-hydroxyacyl-CoA dehydrogenase